MCLLLFTVDSKIIKKDCRKIFVEEIRLKKIRDSKIISDEFGRLEQGRCERD